MSKNGDVQEQLNVMLDTKALSSPVPAMLTTIEDIPPPYQRGGGDIGVTSTERKPLLPQWGRQERERWLRMYDKHGRATLWMGASRGVAKVIASSPWTVTGPKDDVAFWQNFLRDVEFGKGWTPFIQTLGVNFLRHDLGAIIEIQGAGDSDGPIIGPPTGLHNLDPRWVFPTGNPLYPFYYLSRSGGWHKLHYTRVYQLVDSPDGDPNVPSRGLCALSRAINATNQEILISQYLQQVLDDKPPPGITTVSNMTKQKFENEVKLAYARELRNDELGVFGRNILIYGVNPQQVPQVNTFSFSTAPEKFSYQEYMEIIVGMYAAALNISKTQFWELTSGQLGSATQSVIMMQQAEGQTIGLLRAEIERFLNSLLPDEYEFKFEYEDTEKDQDIASTANVWANTVQVVADKLRPDEQRAILANNVAAFGEVMRNPDGTIRTLTDVDPESEEQVQADDTTTVEEEPATVQKFASWQSFGSLARKEWGSTREQFIDQLTTVFQRRHTGVRGTIRLSNSLRSTLRRFGEVAYTDGLNDGGVNVSTEQLTDDDRAAIAVWYQEQSKFVTQLIEKATQTELAGLTPEHARMKAMLWVNKSLRSAYNEGKLGASRDQMLMWVLGATEKHCKTCLGLNGQIHRGSTWQKAQLAPGVDKLDCKGYNCDCKFFKAPGQKARGSLERFKIMECECIAA